MTTSPPVVTPPTTLNDVFLYANRHTTVATAGASTVTVNTTETWQTENTRQLSFSFTAEPGTVFDAADLSLRLATPGWLIDTVVAGTAFPLYPRLRHTRDSAIITGAALVNAASVSYGQPDTPFATVHLVKEPEATLPAELMIVGEETHVVFQGTDVLDLTDESVFVNW